jgi:hypothetical protein
MDGDVAGLFEAYTQLDNIKKHTPIIYKITIYL